jgi:hypothetical protein
MVTNVMDHHLLIGIALARGGLNQVVLFCRILVEEKKRVKQIIGI